MEALVSNVKFTNHSRSISLPTSSHPIVADAEKHLRRLKSSEGASWSSYTSISPNLDGLRHLYACLDNALRLPRSQQLLSEERNGTWEEEILDASLKMLDICNTARDAYSLMKESVQELESSLRRKRGANLDNEIDAYMVSKKKLNRVVCKCLKEVNRRQKTSSMATVTYNSAGLIKPIKEAQEIGLHLLQSSLSFISEPQTKGLSLISKLLPRSKAEAEVSEIRNIEVELLHLNGKKSNRDVDLFRTQNLVKRLGAFGSSIQEMVEALEDIFRLLLKSRVSLLNVLNH